MGPYQRNMHNTQHHIQQLQQQQQQQQHILTDSNYPKKSYNYMASPNYLQFENTYQKYKKICHSKDVTNFRDSNSHCATSGNINKIQQSTKSMYYEDDGPSGNAAAAMAATASSSYHIGDNANGKSNNTMQTLSSDDEGGFRRDLYNTENHFNNDNNGNAHYSTKEVEPLLQQPSNSNGMSQITKVLLS